MDNSKVGFVGLGVMGLAMARNIVRGGHSVTGYDISGEALDKLKQSDGRTATSPAEAASGTAATIVMVPNPEHVEEVVHGKAGILEGLPENGLLIVMSTVDPFTSINVAEKVRSAGFRMLGSHCGRGLLDRGVRRAPTSLCTLCSRHRQLQSLSSSQ